MKRKLFISLFLLCVWIVTGYSQTTEPILKLNTEMHTALLRRVDTDASGQFILTSSDDKTAKLWDAVTGRLIRTYRPPIGAGSEGMLFSGAISPDGKWVALGGFTSRSGDYKSIYIYNTNTGAIYQRIGRLPDVILDLEFSPDGRYLVASLGGANGIKVYETSTFSLYKEDKDYGDFSYNIAFAPSGKLATVSYDGYVRLYDAYFNFIKKVKPSDGARPYNLAFSPDGDRLAIGFRDSPKIQVLDGKSLALLYSPDIKGVNSSFERYKKVAFTKKGAKLVAGGYDLYKNGNNWMELRVWNRAGKGNYSDYIKGNNGITDLKPLPNGNIVYTGTQPDWGILDPESGKRVVYKAANMNNYKAIEKSHFRISHDGFEVGVKLSGQPAIRFHLKDKQIEKQTSSQPGFKDKSGGIKITDWFTSTSAKLNGEPLSFLSDYEKTKSVDISDDRSRIVFGADWTLYCLDAAGTLQWKVTTQATAFCVNISGDGQVVAAGFGDGTIRWYRLSDGQLLLTLFIHPDNKRWVLWTPSGYYDAAPGAEDLLGWHVNQGADKEALFYPISKFRHEYYRPDIIDKILETHNEADAISQANENANKVTTRKRDITKELPPTVKILSPSMGSNISSNTLEITYSITSPNNEEVTDLKVLINGRPAPENRGLKPKGDRGTLKVVIPSKSCRVSILAKNRFGSSEEASVQLNWVGQVTIEADIFKPKLYVLAIGVGAYDNPEYTLDFAAKDARDIVHTLKKQEGFLYKKVVTKLLTDKEATRGNILDGLEWLTKETTQHDVAMIFFAGHGLENNRGTFYYLPVEADYQSLRRNGVMKEEIKETVKTIPGKVVLFMDACNSGSLMTTTRRRGGPDITPIINELIDAENGAVVFSSSTGRQSSLEDTRWNNGAFTKALVEGLNGEADLFGNGKITCKTLDAYITERVKELTGGEQSPTTNFPPNVEDFPIAVKF